MPLYNAERFIRQCLISVLASKFADYEVLVVDDCSTDSSRAEVEKLAPHFDGRLKIFHTEKNSGGAGVPRNLGIEHAAGKYITFVDNDDMILPNALADLYDVAEEFQADVVHTEKFFTFNGANISFKREELTLKKYESGAPVDVPTFEPDDLRERIQRCVAGKFLWIPWSKLYRRDFLRDNRIEFPDMAFTEDLVFCFKCLCVAKKYLRVPAVTNIYRLSQSSTCRKALTSSAGVKLWLRSITEGMSRIFDFMNEREDFQRSTEMKQLTAKFLVDTYFSFIKNLFTSKQPHEVPQIFYDELQNPSLNQKGKDLVAAYLFAERVASLND